MKKIFAIIIALAALTAAAGLCVPISAENPPVQTSFTPDPAPMIYDGRLYLYTGEDSEEDNGFYNMTAWRCYTTDDMVNWTDLGEIMRPEDFEWADPGSAWACQCIERNGKFYLYVTVTNSGGRNIGVAVADSPAGPFKDAIGGPLAGPNWLYIDPTVMIDDDGQAWLYFGNPNAYYCKLNEDMISIDGEIKQQDMTRESFGFKPSFESEAPSSYTEGPWIYKRNDLYYLVYASHGVPEGISYSTASSPEGPWDYRGVIMEPGDSTTIHPGIIDFKGKSYFFYHGVLLDRGGWNKRSTAIAEFEYNDDGTIPLIRHDPAGVSQLENLDPFSRHEAETMSFSEGMRSVTTDGGVYITSADGGGYIKVSGADFQSGAKSFSADICAKGGTLEIRLDAPDGKKIGKISLGGTKSGESVGCNLSGVSGVHDIFFVLKGAKGLEFDSWAFSAEAGSYGGGPSVWVIIGAAAVIAVCVAAAAVVIWRKKR